MIPGKPPDWGGLIHTLVFFSDVLIFFFSLRLMRQITLNFPTTMSAFQSSFIQILVFLLMVQPAMSQHDLDYAIVGTEWEESSNWHHSFQQLFGTDLSSSWLNEQIANGAIILESPSQEGLILVQKRDFGSEEESMESLEETILYSQVSLIPSSDIRPFGQHAYYHSFRGNIQGKVISGQRIHLASDNGDYWELLIINNQLANRQTIHPLALDISRRLEFSSGLANPLRRK